jgi:hypothetical protein
MRSANFIEIESDPELDAKIPLKGSLLSAILHLTALDAPGSR